MVDPDGPGPAPEGWPPRLWEVLAADPSLTMVADGDAAYPANLAGLHGRPPVLFVRGRLDPADVASVAVIGTRQATPLGRDWARRAAADLAGAGWTVVSGLARGIDAEAHRGAIDAGGRTLAVLGSGLDVVYPPEHAGLAAEVARAGATISQWWPWAPPAPHRFRRRNALCAGLARATLVVEAGARSGARLQARLARGQGRPVLLAARLAAAEPWARDLVEADAASVVAGAGDVVAMLGGLCPPGLAPLPAAPVQLRLRLG
ncbi:MAG: DNA-processing protein DprA [Acidimicrobiales bacterium]